MSGWWLPGVFQDGGDRVPQAAPRVPACRLHQPGGVTDQGTLGGVREADLGGQVQRFKDLVDERLDGCRPPRAQVPGATAGGLDGEQRQVGIHGIAPIEEVPDVVASPHLEGGLAGLNPGQEIREQEALGHARPDLVEGADHEDPEVVSTAQGPRLAELLGEGVGVEGS